MEKLRVVVICNNYGEKYDGIGAFAKVVYGQPDGCTIKIISYKCYSGGSVFQKIFNLGMSKAIIETTAWVLKKKADAVIIEYPFVEQNPLIMAPLMVLKVACRAKKTKLCLSLHEYQRVFFLRKAVIRFINRLCDVIFCASREMAEPVARQCQKVIIRKIPSNIPRIAYCDTKTGFVYFGLLGKTKKVKEMIEAVGRTRVKLKFITASEVPQDIAQNEFIEIFQDIEDVEVSQILAESAICILPIEPMIDYKNASFAAAVCNGCICIGKFSDEYKKFPFLIDINDYEPSTLENAINYVKGLPKSELQKMTAAAYQYGANFTKEGVLREITVGLSMKNENRG